MEIVTTRAALAEALAVRNGRPRGFVPTMGALHAGHISLVERARRENRVVVVSVFVNPTQFNDPGDLERYPRTPQEDIRLLDKAGTDIVFMPAPQEIYPEPDTRVFVLAGVSEVMEGATRPGHFNGVAQVVSRLFDLVRPDRAYFGEKDFQQVAVIRAMCRECGYGLDIVACPTVREDDGLAMSSRNTLLDPAHRAAAPAIYRAMDRAAQEVREALAKGSSLSVAEVERRVTEEINSEQLLEVIYFRLVNAHTLAPARSWDEEGGVQGCVAVQAGTVRLIDNLRFI
ncbi:MAG: pantoate--beta-alanine ligase [Rikenellaceae bacterium]|nr:pantoate--beta-alanine ligase [Rikenellaceae bacterium]